MRYVFPLNAYATNVTMLIALTMSYICYPFLALMLVHIFCTYIPDIDSYNRMYFSSAAFLFVGIYCVIGIVIMYISFFRRKTKK